MFGLNSLALLGIMGIGYHELIIVLVIVLLLFGSTKLPALMRSMGQGIGEFKKGMNTPVDDAEPESGESPKV